MKNIKKLTQKSHAFLKMSGKGFNTNLNFVILQYQCPELREIDKDTIGIADRRQLIAGQIDYRCTLQIFKRSGLYFFDMVEGEIELPQTVQLREHLL